MKSLHEKWVYGEIPNNYFEQAYFEGPYGEIKYYQGNTEITRWPYGNDTVRTKEWYKKNYYEKIKMEKKIENTSNLNCNETSEKKPKRKILKGIICLLFGHDWVSYNEHAWICSRCMEVAPKG